MQVILHLRVRKFYCDQPTCARRIFAERLPQVTSPHGRFSFGLRQFLGQLGQEQGGASAERSAALQGMQVTARAILRFMHALPLPPIPPPQIIGLDEWAWKRGQRYGAIIVDLERNKPIALLADRSQQTVARWLKQHPTIQVVARDRSEEFAAAIREALPQAVQVADRFHLVSNLVEHLDRLVTRQWKGIYRALVPPAALDQGEAHASYAPARAERRLANAQAGEAKYQQALALRERGLGNKEIGQRLGVGTRTIGRWMSQQRGPATQRRRKKPSQLDRFVPYLLHRWADGCRNGTVLHRELASRGYPGGARTVYKFAASLTSLSPCLSPSEDSAAAAFTPGWRDASSRGPLAPAAG